MGNMLNQWTRLKWRLMDALIAGKERIPIDFRDIDHRLGYLLIIPGVLLVGFLAVGMGVLLVYSFLTFDPIEFLVYELTVENWKEFFEVSAYHSIFLRTLLFSVAVTILAIVFGIPYAYMIVRVRSSLLRKVLIFGLFVPFFTGVIIRAYGWLIIFGKNGMVNWALKAIGLAPLKIIGTDIAVLIGLVQHMLPYSVLMITPALAGIDRDLERAAQNLGANPWETLRYIILPLAKPGLAAGAIVVYTITMATYSIPRLLGAGRVTFAANYIYLKLFDQFNYPIAAVMSIVLVLIGSIVVLGIFRVYGTGTLGMEVDDR